MFCRVSWKVGQATKCGTDAIGTRKGIGGFHVAPTGLGLMGQASFSLVCNRAHLGIAPTKPYKGR